MILDPPSAIPSNLRIIATPILVGILFLGCGHHEEPGSNVVLITVDTLRADHLGTYGYHRETSPSIDRFAKTAALYERAYCPIPRTLPSLASLVTGLDPVEHGVRSNYHYRLPEEAVTVAEDYKSKGYRTAVFMGNPLVNKKSGLLQGFDHIRVHVAWMTTQADSAQGISPAGTLTNQAIQWLERKAKPPFFLWVHYLDPHMPYSPLPTDSAHFDPDYEGPLKRFLAFARYGQGTLTFGGVLAPRDHKRAIVLYDAEVRGTDRQVGRLITKLDHRFPESRVLLTSDHGESLGEHSYYYDHGEMLYEPSLRIPLLVRAEGFPPGSRSPVPVDLLDVAATLRNWAGLEPIGSGRFLGTCRMGAPPPSGTRPVFAESGLSIFPRAASHPMAATMGERTLLQAEPEEYHRLLEAGFLANKLRSIRVGERKLIHCPFDRHSRWELYDTGNDPLDETDLYRENKDDPTVIRMRKQLRDWMSRDPGGRRQNFVPIDEEKARNLRSLGYL